MARPGVTCSAPASSQMGAIDAVNKAITMCLMTSLPSPYTAVTYWITVHPISTSATSAKPRLRSPRRDLRSSSPAPARQAVQYARTPASPASTARGNR